MFCRFICTPGTTKLCAHYFNSFVPIQFVGQIYTISDQTPICCPLITKLPRYIVCMFPQYKSDFPLLKKLTQRLQSLSGQLKRSFPFHQGDALCSQLSEVRGDNLLVKPRSVNGLFGYSHFPEEYVSEHRSQLALSHLERKSRVIAITFKNCKAQIPIQYSGLLFALRGKHTMEKFES